MTPDAFLKTIVNPTLERMAVLTGIATSDQARVMLLATAGQESAWQHRLQIGGPARGFWQFEKMGGVAEVIQVTPVQLKAVCGALDIPFDRDTLYEAMAWNDTLACAMARLLLWQDSAPLPALGDEGGGYDFYIRNWRPGAPSRSRWAIVYPQSLAFVVKP